MGLRIQSVSEVMEDVCFRESAVSEWCSNPQTDVKRNGHLRAKENGKLEEERLTGVIDRDS